MFGNFFPENRAVYEIVWRICTTAFLLLRWLRERASKLHYTCVSYLFKTQA